MKAEEFLNQYKTDNTDGSISFESICKLMEEYHQYKLGQHFNESNVKTLRDEFAMSVIFGNMEFLSDSLYHDIDDIAYRIADKMIERRKQH